MCNFLIDSFIHRIRFSCMPEVVTSYFYVKIERDQSVPKSNRTLTIPIFFSENYLVFVLKLSDCLE